MAQAWGNERFGGIFQRCGGCPMSPVLGGGTGLRGIKHMEGDTLNIAALIDESVPFEVKVSRTKRQFEGYASTFGNMDLVGDIIENGAFRKTIAERGPKGANKIKILWQHNEAFGMPVKMAEDEHGLWVVGQASDTQENKDRLAYMEDGVVDSMSIGFTIPDKKSWWEEDEEAPWGM